MKKLFLVFMLLTPFAMATYGDRSEIVVSPTYVTQKKENGSKVGKYALGSGVKVSKEEMDVIINSMLDKKIGLKMVKKFNYWLID